jgi:hypothetical protein
MIGERGSRYGFRPPNTKDEQHSVTSLQWSSKEFPFLSGMQASLTASMRRRARDNRQGESVAAHNKQQPLAVQHDQQERCGKCIQHTVRDDSNEDVLFPGDRIRNGKERQNPTRILPG